MIKPGQVIGIIGGGQLGKMMAVEANTMGYQVIVLDPNPLCCASSVAHRLIVASYDDEQALTKLAQLSDVVTYEFENVNYELIDKLAKTYPIAKGYQALKVSNHRLLEKQFANKLGIACAPYRLVNNLDDLLIAIQALGFPLILKTCTLGYDGKGQVKLNSANDIEACLELINQQACIVEKKIDFDYEVSVILARGYHDTLVYEIPRNLHIDGILAQSLVPARLSPSLKTKVIEASLKISEELDYLGVMACEFFVNDDAIYFNEMAPRPHNSGHYTLDAYRKNQFKAHIEAICGYRLGSEKLQQNVLMLNILGQDLTKVNNLINKQELTNYSLYLYGKDEAKHNRKIGHLNLYGESIKQLNYMKEQYFGGEDA